MTKTVISIDPGKASGVAVLDYTDLDDVKILYSGELDQQETCEFIENLVLYEEHMLESSPDRSFEVVYEKFQITAQTGKNTNEENWSAEIIGVIKFLCRKHGFKFTVQTPAEAKNFVPNDRMKAVGIWHTGGEGHAKDALRHGVLFLVKNKGWRPPNLLAPE